MSDETALIAAAKRAQRTTMAFTIAATVVLAAAIGAFLLYGVDELTSASAAIAQKTAALNTTTVQLRAAQQIIAAPGNPAALARDLHAAQGNLLKVQLDLKSSQDQLKLTRDALIVTQSRIRDYEARLQVGPRDQLKIDPRLIDPHVIGLRLPPANTPVVQRPLPNDVPR
jgi:hypothetical protein